MAAQIQLLPPRVANDEESEAIPSLPVSAPPAALSSLSQQPRGSETTIGGAGLIIAVLRRGGGCSSLVVALLLHWSIDNGSSGISINKNCKTFGRE